jgi:3-oxoacyl-[acyl-carrier protein] reductase
MSILDGKKTLVIGGAGEVGEGIVRQFLNAGATVVVPSRSQYRLDELRQRLEGCALSRLITKQAGCGTEAGAMDLYDFVLDELSELDVVVASIGGWWQGDSLLNVPLRLWNQLIENSLTAHFVAAKTFLPLLAEKDGGRYIMLNGGAALKVIPNAGPISVSAAAQLVLKDVLVEEMKESNVSINTLLISTPIITRSRDVHKPFWLTADEVGLYTAHLASGDLITVPGETIVLNSREELPVLPL